MSLSIKYESLDDARMRLRGTVVKYDNQPCYIENIEPDPTGEGPYRVLAHLLPYKPVRGMLGNPYDIVYDDNFDPVKVKPNLKKFISSRHFDIAPFRMGFVNDERLCYVSRLPARQQQQGLSEKNCSITTVDGKEQITFLGLISSDKFVDCCNSVYPDFETALGSACVGKATAFHREFALVPDADIGELVYIFHKTAKVGFVKGGVCLGKKAFCLKELLLEANARLEL